MAVIFTICIGLLDVYINSPEIVKKLKIPPNAMTLYDGLPKEGKELLLSYLEKKDRINITYGGTVYNTFMEIAQRNQRIRSVFIGPFSTSSLSMQVFKNALNGEINGLTIIPEMVDLQPGMCFVIPNGSNRAMITKINSEMKITRKMVGKLISHIKKREITKKRTLVYIAGYTIETSPILEEIAKKQIKRKMNVCLCLNLSDPGVIKRSYKKIRMFIHASEWVIGNKQEFEELYHQIEGTYPESVDHLHSLIQKHVRNAIITSGEDSVVALYKEREMERIAIAYPEKIKISDTTGAGDIIAACILSGIAKNRNINEILPRAVKRTTEYLFAKSKECTNSS